MIHVRLNKLEHTARSIARQIPSTLGAAALVLALLLAADHVGAAPWKTETTTAPRSPTGDRLFTMPYQGRLTDAAGVPVNNTAPGFPMTFALYTQETGSAPVWSEHHPGVPVSDGLFNVYLGSITPLDSVLFDDDLWLGVTIGSDSEMTPREQLGAAAYVMWQGAGVPVGTVISWWRPDANTPLPSDEWAIADGSVITDTGSIYYGQPLPDLRERFIMGVAPADVGQTGGANTLDITHSHSIPAHRHSVTGATGEVHGMWDGGYYNAGSESYRYAINTYQNTWYTRHNHSLNLDTSSWSGDTNTTSLAPDNRPAYVGLLFLVRIK